MTAFTDSFRSAIIKSLPGAVTGAGAGNRAVVKIPPGSTYADLLLKCDVGAVGATRAQIVAGFTEVRLTVSGVEMWTLSGAELAAIVDFYRTTAGVPLTGGGYLTIPFERLWMQGAIAQLDPNYGTAGESSVQLEIVQAGGSAITAIEAYARINPLSEPLGKHIVVRRFTVAVPAAGRFIYPDLPKIPGEALFALHLGVPTVADVQSVAFVGDNIRVWDDIPPALLDRVYLESVPVRTPQAGYVHMDFTNRGFDSDVLLTGLLQSQALEIVFSTAVPGRNLVILGEYGSP